jgi:hypothetical protein
VLVEPQTKNLVKGLKVKNLADSGFSRKRQLYSFSFAREKSLGDKTWLFTISPKSQTRKSQKFLKGK